MAIMRNHTAQWGVDPRRIGLIGFSAGAFLPPILRPKGTTSDHWFYELVW